MALDDETRRIAMEAMGSNALAQLELVVPEFFDGNYVLLQLVSGENSGKYAVKLDLAVAVSNVPDYTPGQVLSENWENEIAEMVGAKKYNVSVTPTVVERGIVVKDKEFNTITPFVAAEGEAEFWEFESPMVFYTHQALVYHGGSITEGIPLSEGGFHSGACRSTINFVFVPVGDKPRDVIEIVEGEFSRGTRKLW